MAILYDSFEEDAEACEDCNKADHTIHGIPPLICLGQEVMLIRLQHRRFKKKSNADLERQVETAQSNILQVDEEHTQTYFKTTSKVSSMTAKLCPQNWAMEIACIAFVSFVKNALIDLLQALQSVRIGGRNPYAEIADSTYNEIACSCNANQLWNPWMAICECGLVSDAECFPWS